MAIDGSGNVWVNGGPQVISNLGTQLSQILGGWNSPGGVAVDSGGNAWIVDSANNNLHKITNGLTQTVYTGGGLSRPQGVAIDGGGNVWVANRNGNSVSEFSNSGTPISPAAGFAVNYFLSPAGIAIDGSGNVWVTNLSNGSVTQVVGAAVPVITPIAAGLPATPTLNGTSSLGTRP
jgi:streptogramin lyase